MPITLKYKKYWEPIINLRPFSKIKTFGYILMRRTMNYADYIISDCKCGGKPVFDSCV